MNKNDMFYYITNFFTNYLNREAGLSVNTIKSYRDAFILFFKYLEDEKICKIKKLRIDILTQNNITGFLDWIEKSRDCSISSRNQRLAALKAFCNYIIRKNPVEGNLCQGILNIRAKKTFQKQIDYLSIESIAYLLRMPDNNMKRGIRDLCILSLMYESGCRVQEIIDLKIGNISFKAPNTITVIGKGKKARVIPIDKKATKIIESYLNIFRRQNLESYVFINRYEKPLSRSGIAYILNKYVQIARKKRPDLFNLRVHPHVFRHSKAMHMLESGVNLIYIRDFLGHSSVTTTEIYARCNPEIKRKYIEQTSSLITDSIEKYSTRKKETLLEWLNDNI